MTRDKFLKRLKIQEKIEGSTANINLCRVVIEHCKDASDINAFFKIKFHRYGVSSYETHMFYYVKENIINMFNDPKVQELSKEVKEVKEVQDVVVIN